MNKFFKFVIVATIVFSSITAYAGGTLMPRDGEAAPFKNGVDYNWKAVGSMWQENHKADFAGVIPQNFSGCLIAWSDDGKWLYATSAARFGLVHVPPGTYVPGEGRATESNEHWMCTKDMMR